MFSTPDYVFKDGTMIVKNGELINVTWGTTHVVKPEYDASIET
jgi:formylmethanofuran dehydrogenase subunit A